MRRYATIAVALLLAGCGSASQVRATRPTTQRTTQTGVAASCAGLSPAQQLAAARLVFVGVMLPGPTTGLGGRRVLGSPASMRVERYLKGDGPALVKVDTAVRIEPGGYRGNSEGIEPQAGERWKIYTSSRRQPFDTSICLGSARVSAQPTPATRALALWRAFPAGANPRPIVPLGEGLVLDPASGFPSSAQKIAYLEGRFSLRAALPRGPTAIGRFHIVSAATAYRRLGANANGQRYDVPPLIVTAVKPGSATFATDRGRRQLPAWQFYFKGVASPASVLALGPPDLFVPSPLHRFGPPGPGNSIEDSAKAPLPGTEIEISFPGALAGTGPCEANYRAASVSSEHAVAFTITVLAKPVPPGQACPAIAVIRTVTLHLARPLGGRVLVSAADGGAIQVTVGAPKIGRP